MFVMVNCWAFVSVLSHPWTFCVSVGFCGGRPVLLPEWRGKPPLRQLLTPLCQFYKCKTTLHTSEEKIILKWKFLYVCCGL